MTRKLMVTDGTTEEYTLAGGAKTTPSYFASIVTGPEPISTIAQPAMTDSMRKAAAPSATMIRIRHLLVVEFCFFPFWARRPASRIYSGDRLSSVLQDINCSEFHERGCGQLRPIAIRPEAARGTNPGQLGTTKFAAAIGLAVAT
jgi:hypothetical protein